VVNHRHRVNYIKALARQNGQKLKQQKQSDGVFMLWCVGHCQTSTASLLAALNSQREAKRRWREKNSKKYECQVMTRKLLRAGIVVRQPCKVCGSRRSCAFHEDYSKPAEVIWLCHQHRKSAERNAGTLNSAEGHGGNAVPKIFVRPP
jgi:hypothetical protein